MSASNGKPQSGRPWKALLRKWVIGLLTSATTMVIAGVMVVSGAMVVGTSQSLPVQRELHAWRALDYEAGRDFRLATQLTRGEFVVQTSLFETEALLWFIIECYGKLVITVLFFTTFCSTLSVSTEALLLYRYGIQPQELFGVRRRIDRSTYVRLALSIVVTTVVFFFLRRHMVLSPNSQRPSVAGWLWAASLPLLFWYALSDLRVYRYFRTTSRGGTRLYLQALGARQVLLFVASAWVCAYSLGQLFPASVEQGLAKLRHNIHSQAERFATSLLPPSDRAAALEVVRKGLIPYEHGGPVGSISVVIEEGKGASVKILLLLGYTSLAAPLFAYRHPRHPYLMFFAYGTCAAAAPYLFEAALRWLFGPSLESEGSRYLIALAGVGLGLYLGFLFGAFRRE